jgi:molybdopterin converting factor small subunit
MASVRIPPVLRQYTGGARDVSVEGTTVGVALGRLADQYPSLKSHLFQDGTLQRYVNVYVNNQDVGYLNGLDTPLADNDTVIILPAMAGGCA